MGNKNYRGKSATFSTRTPSAGSSMSQMDAATQPVKARSDSGLVGDFMGEVTPDSSTTPGTKTSPLPFLSYQTGTLHSDNFEASGSTEKTATTNSKKRLSGASPAFVPSNKTDGSAPAETKTLKKLMDLLATFPKNSHHDRAKNGKMSTISHSEGILATPTDRSVNTGITSTTATECKGEAKMVNHFLTRADKSKKDVIIDHCTVWHNVVRLLEYQYPSGATYYVPTEEFQPPNYIFERVHCQMRDKERIDFWTNNWVEIVVNIGEIGVCSDFWAKSAKDIEEDLLEHQVAIVNVMNRLGEGFTTYTRNVFVIIQFPDDNRESLPNKVNSCTKEQQDSPGYRAIQNIANKLKEFSSLARVEIILRTPAYSRNPISLEQLNYALPFYELPFTNWLLKWQNTFMSRPETVRGWPIAYLDIERGKIDREITKVMREQERALQEQIFVRASDSPEVHDLPFAPRAENPKPGVSTPDSSDLGSAKTV